MPRGFYSPRSAALLLVGVLAALPARADIAATVNSLRADDCRPRSGRASALHVNRTLNAVAQSVARGATLHDALSAARYRARASRLLVAAGVPSGSEFRAVAARKFCAQIAEPALTEIGSAQRGDQVWVVLAEPFAAPALLDSGAVARETLSLVNAARAQPRVCGSRAFAAAAPLQISAVLTKAAAGHVADLSAHDRLTHQGTDGSNPGTRATRAGYRWRTIGENIAAGPETARRVVAGWLASPEHCANIMDERFTQMGIAYHVDWQTRAGVYWVQSFGRPR